MPRLIVHNKTDLTGFDLGIKRDACAKIRSVNVSAKTGDGLSDLIFCVMEILEDNSRHKLDAKSSDLHVLQ